MSGDDRFARMLREGGFLPKNAESAALAAQPPRDAAAVATAARAAVAVTPIVPGFFAAASSSSSSAAAVVSPAKKGRRLTDDQYARVIQALTNQQLDLVVEKNRYPAFSATNVRLRRELDEIFAVRTAPMIVEVIERNRVPECPWDQLPPGDKRLRDLMAFLPSLGDVEIGDFANEQAMQVWVDKLIRWVVVPFAKAESTGLGLAGLPFALEPERRAATTDEKFVRGNILHLLAGCQNPVAVRVLEGMIRVMQGGWPEDLVDTECQVHSLNLVGLRIHEVFSGRDENADNPFHVAARSRLGLGQLASLFLFIAQALFCDQRGPDIYDSVFRKFFFETRDGAGKSVLDLCQQSGGYRSKYRTWHALVQSFRAVAQNICSAEFVESHVMQIAPFLLQFMMENDKIWCATTRLARVLAPAEKLDLDVSLGEDKILAEIERYLSLPLQEQQKERAETDALNNHRAQRNERKRLLRAQIEAAERDRLAALPPRGSVAAPATASAASVTKSSPTTVRGEVTQFMVQPASAAGSTPSSVPASEGADVTQFMVQRP